MENREYEIVRSNRKTLALQVSAEGRVVVRAPRTLAKRRIEAFVNQHWHWVEMQKARQEALGKQAVVFSEEERRAGMEEACRVLPERAAYFAERMGVTYGKISVREQKTLWGSCSRSGNLSFNWKLVRMTPEVLDYVVVHELAHRKEMNHSPRFWAVVEQELPDYRERRRELKKQGELLR